MKENTLQETMFQELKDKSIFKQVTTHAYEYLDTVLDRNVYPTDSDLSNLKYFEEKLPEHSAKADEVIELLNKYGAPATVAGLGGRYFGFVTGSAIPVGLATKSLATFWDQNSAMQVLSPVSAKLELVVESWLKEIFGLPSQTVAGFVSGTSMANFCGLAAARYRVLKNLNWDINNQGLFNAPTIRIVTGKQAHSTIHKAIGLLGFGKDHVEWVDVDDHGRIVPASLPPLDSRTILILQAGNVNTGSFDDFDKIMGIAKAANAWVHIDGAFGLWASAVDELKHLTKGIEHADSWAVDGHKTLNTPYDNGIVLCSDKEAIVSALHMIGSYIVVGDQRDGMYYTPEMSRRARVIELWATMKYLGKSGISQMINGLHERAVQFNDELNKIAGFELVNQVVFNQVLVRCETDLLTEKTLSTIQELRECWVGGSMWAGRKVIRISVCSWATTEADVTRSVKSFDKALQQVMNQ
jgi:glutamate/tyrosine decarboxylase-like PLP-dependent enzyme